MGQIHEEINTNGVELNSRWVWIIDVVYGGILTLGFRVFETELSESWSKSHLIGIYHSYVAFAALAFYLYDIGIYHLLVNTFPFRLSFLSSCRYGLDILMAFLLMKILLPCLRTHPEGSIFSIITSITLWHFSAAAWHCLANWDTLGKWPKVYAVAPHFVFPMLYWSAIGLWYVFASEFLKINGVRHPSFMIVFSTVVLLAALYRSRQLVSKLTSSQDQLKVH